MASVYSLSRGLELKWCGQVGPWVDHWPRYTHGTRNNSEQVIDESKLKPSFIKSQHESDNKVLRIRAISLVQLDYERAVATYLSAQGTFKNPSREQSRSSQPKAISPIRQTRYGRIVCGKLQCAR